MKLKIGKNEYIIKRVSTSIHTVDEEEYFRQRVECAFKDEVDIVEISNVISQDFHGDFEIITEEKTYTYTNFEFDSANTQIGPVEIVTTISFYKDLI